MITNVLIKDKSSAPITLNQKGQEKYYTNAPSDIFKIFNEILEVIQAK